MKRIFLLFLISSNIYSQKNDIKKQQLNIDVQQLMLSDAPRYTLGYGLMLNENWELNLALGYGNAKIMPVKSLNLIYDFNDDYKLFEIRPEVKYYYRTNVKTPHFVSLEFSYLNHQDHFSIGSYTNYDSNWAIGYRQANYQRIKIAATLNYGFDLHFNKEHTFGLTPKLGFGVRKRNVEFTNLIDAKPYEVNDEVFIYPNQREGDFVYYAGKRFGFDMLFTIKGFYKF